MISRTLLLISLLLAMIATAVMADAPTVTQSADIEKGVAVASMAVTQGDTWSVEANNYTKDLDLRAGGNFKIKLKDAPWLYLAAGAKIGYVPTADTFNFSPTAIAKVKKGKVTVNASLGQFTPNMLKNEILVTGGGGITYMTGGARIGISSSYRRTLGADDGKMRLSLDTGYKAISASWTPPVKDSPAIVTVGVEGSL